MTVIDYFVKILNSINEGLSSYLPSTVYLGLSMFLFALIIAFTAFIIWKFYRTLSKKNFIHLDLRKYNRSEHPVGRKLFAIIFYFVEYILIMPIFITLWFILLSTILLLLATEREASQILILAGAMIMAIRVLAYFNEEISKDLGKLFPFIALSLFLLSPGAFEINTFILKVSELPVLLNNMIFFFILIFLLEIIMRVIYTVVELFKGHEEVGEEVENESKR
jgi:hypothetical protein